MQHSSESPHCIQTELGNRNTKKPGSLLCLQGLGLFGEQTGEEERIAGSEVNLVASLLWPQNPQRQLHGGVFSQLPFSCTLFYSQREIISLQRALLAELLHRQFLTDPSPMYVCSLCHPEGLGAWRQLVPSSAGSCVP